MIPKIYTSYFAKIAQLVKSGILPVAISRTVPSWFEYPRVKELAPLWVTVEKIKKSKHTEADKQEYIYEYYRTILDPHLLRIRQLLEFIVHKVNYDNTKYPNGIALLCYEKPSDFCHRHIFAEWVNSEYPGSITEWQSE